MIETSQASRSAPDGLGFSPALADGDAEGVVAPENAHEGAAELAAGGIPVPRFPCSGSAGAVEVIPSQAKLPMSPS